MPEDIVIRVLLLPVALLYGIGVSIRNLLYRVGILRSVRFDLPVISVGNMTVGGTGKSPHIEYLMRWLHQYINVAVLSRGYGRSTAGYRTVISTDSALSVGDEPLQFKRKFPEVPVSVSESRALGVPELVRLNPGTNCVLLDDAFQHIAVTPGMNILLTEYNRPFTKDWLLPSGRLREWRSGYRRADLIIVTKCPEDLDEKQRSDMVFKIDPYPWQKVFFSHYQYTTPYDLFRPDMLLDLEPDTDVLLISAIANTDYMLDYLKKNVRSVYTMEFEDHHYFSETDLLELRKRFKQLDSSKKIILTTEKDATRLELHREVLWENELPVYVLPIQVEFLGNDEKDFQKEVRTFLMDFKV